MIYALIVTISTITGSYGFTAHKRFETLEACASFADDVKMVVNNSSYVNGVAVKCVKWKKK